MKKILALCLVIVMLLGLAACAPQVPNPTESQKPSESQKPTESNPTESTPAATDPADELAYLNMDSALPLVKPDSGEKITLSVYAVKGSDNDKKLENIWEWKYLMENAGIELDIEVVDHLALTEQKNLTLATGNLPDILLGYNLTSSDLMTYGVEEGLLMDLSDLIDNYAPDIKAVLDNYPHIRSGWTTPDGAIYSLGTVASAGSTNGYSFFVNEDWMKAAGVTELPENLDEFLDMLRKFKTLHPDDENYWPLGGCWGADNTLWGLLQAYGVLTQSFRHDQMDQVNVINDHIGLIVGDEVYGEFLKFCNTLHTEGLISPDYFTRDHNASRAEAGEERCGVYAQFQMSTMNSFVKNADGTAATKERQEEFQAKWRIMKPMTSAFNDTPVYLQTSGIKIGGFAISAECEYPEVAIRLANWYYSAEGNLIQSAGPLKGTDETYGLVGSVSGLTDGWYMEEKDGSVVVNSLSAHDWRSNNQYMGVNNDNTLVSDTGKTLIELKYEAAGFAGKAPEANTFNTNTLKGRLDKEKFEARDPYKQMGVPNVIFMDAETSARVADLKSVIKDFATAETAKFITGARPLDQIPDYLRQISAIGGAEINEIYTELFPELVG